MSAVGTSVLPPSEEAPSRTITLALFSATVGEGLRNLLQGDWLVVLIRLAAVVVELQQQRVILLVP